MARGRYIAIKACPRKEEKNQINDLKQLEEDMKNLGVSRMKEIKIRPEISEKETKDTIQKKSAKLKSGSLRR